MTEPQPYRDVDRRHPHISHEELRRQLIAADEERYRLQNELRAPRAAHPRGWSAWPQRRRRIAVGIGTVVMTGLAGGLAWQMCPSAARADDRPSVRVVTREVAPQVVVTDRAAMRPVDNAPRVASVAKVTSILRVSARPRARAAFAAKKPPVHAAVVARRVDPTPRRAVVPRPLSPGEFGRPRLAAF